MKIKKRTVKIALFGLAIIAALWLAYFYQNRNPYSFEGASFSYSQDRGKADYQISLKSENSTFDVYGINFKSRNFLSYETRIYGILLMPKGSKNVPGLVLLPGGGVKKESEMKVASKIAELGYAVLTIDQRGIGETGGYYLNLEQDYGVFAQGNEPIQHLSVYDALRAFDVLRSMNNVDKGNIAIAGESMGGRYAIIAAAVDKRLKGVIAISTSGFNVKEEDTPYNSYLLSIDPDRYIGKISPRSVFMLHGTNDSTVPLDAARATFNLANEPKKFYTADGCGHGYCDKMHETLNESLSALFGRKV